MHRDVLFQRGAKYVLVFVCALKLGTAGEICAGRCPKLPEQAELASVIAPSAKNSLPRQGRIPWGHRKDFEGARFHLAGPQCNPVALSPWFVGVAAGKGAGKGVKGHTGWMHVPVSCKIWGKSTLGHLGWGCALCLLQLPPLLFLSVHGDAQDGDRGLGLLQFLSPKMLTGEGLLHSGSSPCPRYLPRVERPI